jgi:hypothetical protein
MKYVLILTALLASAMGCNRTRSSSEGEIRVTKTELVVDHDLQNDPQVCWITAVGRQGGSRVEYRAVNWDGNCPEIETTVVIHDEMLIKKNDPAFASSGSTFWAASVKSTKEIQ